MIYKCIIRKQIRLNVSVVRKCIEQNQEQMIILHVIFHNDEFISRLLYGRLQCTEGHDAEISGAIFGCLLLEQVATFGEYFCRFLRPAVAGRRKEKFYHHHNSKVLRSIFGLVSVMALILRLLPLPSLKGHNSAP